jgi:hypothetical protein
VGRTQGVEFIADDEPRTVLPKTARIHDLAILSCLGIEPNGEIDLPRFGLIMDRSAKSSACSADPNFSSPVVDEALLFGCVIDDTHDRLSQTAGHE